MKKITPLREGQKLEDKYMNVFIVKCFDNEKVIVRLLDGNIKEDKRRNLIEYTWGEMQEIFGIEDPPC